MQIASETVVDGKVIVEGLSLPEGTVVTVLAWGGAGQCQFEIAGSTSKQQTVVNSNPVSSGEQSVFLPCCGEEISRCAGNDSAIKL